MRHDFALLAICVGAVCLGLSVSAGTGRAADLRAAERRAPDLRAGAQEGFALLNRLRQAAGMAPFARNVVLDQAAQGHADYLAANRATGHDQQAGRRGFTGRAPAERVRRAGYPHKLVSENVAQGEQTATAAVDGLMAAIYHRLGFLSFDLDEVGIGLRQEQGRERYVFNMGQAGLRETCTQRPAAARYHPPGSYLKPCADDFAVTEAYYERVRGAVAERNPRVVLWPPADGHDTPPAFFNEWPDPLPDYAVSGYPVSVQFNPRKVGQVQLRAFRLFAESGPGAGGIAAARLTELRATRLFTKASDPHHKFDALEFALFPLQRLEWGRPYVAEFEAVVDGKAEHLRWRFHTRETGAPTYLAQGRGEALPVVAGRSYAVYLPPTPQAPTMGAFSYSAGDGAKPSLERIDPNTLRVVVTGPACAGVEVRSAGGRSFTLRLAAQDTTAGPVAPEVLYGACPEFAADYRIQARGERLAVAAGREYLVYVAPTAAHARLPGFKYRMPSGTKPQIAYASAHALRIRVEGAVCSTVTLEFEDGRGFAVQIANGPVAGGSGRVPGC